MCLQECWAAEPQRRPTFEAIAETLRAMYPKTKEWPHPDEAARAAVAAAKSDAAPIARPKDFWFYHETACCFRALAKVLPRAKPNLASRRKKRKEPGSGVLNAWMCMNTTLESSPLRTAPLLTSPC